MQPVILSDEDEDDAAGRVAVALTQRLEQELHGLALVPHDGRPDLQDLRPVDSIFTGSVSKR